MCWWSVRTDVGAFAGTATAVAAIRGILPIPTTEAATVHASHNNLAYTTPVFHKILIFLTGCPNVFWAARLYFALIYYDNRFPLTTAATQSRLDPTFFRQFAVFAGATPARARYTPDFDC